MTSYVKKYRIPEYPISDVILERWSPRAFSTKPVADDVLNRVFEAARWAPSARNAQPWRFIVAKTPEQLKKFHSILMDSNLVWAKNAPVLAIVISDKSFGTHEFDTGTAWGFLSLQAQKEGLITHPMGGIHKEIAHELLNIPENFEVQLAIAIGYQGNKNELPEALQAREQPSTRLPLEEIVFEGSYK